MMADLAGALAEAATAAAVVAAGLLVWTLRLRALGRARGDDDARGPAPAPGPLPVSIIVPARNEAHNLPALLGSLARLDPRPLEVIVVDDHSTDGTGDLARAAGMANLQVVTPPPLPAGWNGKPWACRAGALAARGEYLLFTDADTVHAPDSLGRAMARMRATGAALLSVVPTHVVHAAWEAWQGVFHLLLLVACRAGGAEPGARPAGKRERRFSIGQYLLFRRDVYERLGGHEPVRRRIAEDLAFARLIVDMGLGFTVLFRTGLLRVRMYPEGLGAFVRGWRRNFREGMTAAGAGGVLEMIAVVGWLLGLPLFLLQAALAGQGALAGLWAAAYLLSAAEVARRQRALGAFPAWTGLAYPVFVTLFALISALAVIDRARGAKVMWRGREAVPGGESARE